MPDPPTIRAALAVPPTKDTWLTEFLSYAARTGFNALIVFLLLALTATDLSDLSEVKSALLVGAIFGVGPMAGVWKDRMEKKN